MLPVNLNGLLCSRLPGLLVCIFLSTVSVRGESSTAAIESAPVLDRIESDDLQYTSGSGWVTITGTLTVSDKDSKNLRSASVQIESGFNADEDVLRFTNQNRISGSWDKATGVLTLTGSSSLAHYQTALRSIEYENTNTLNPSTISRTVTFSVNDGLDNSNKVTRNIAMIVIDKPPRLTNIESVPIVYCENSGAIPITSTLNINDPDNTNLASATLQIITGYTQHEELRFSGQNGISGSWDGSTGILTLTGLATITNYQIALRSIVYVNADAVTPNTGNHQISFAVNDGTTSSNTLTRSIKVNGRVSGILTGSAGICNDLLTTAPLSIDFTGTSPWIFSLLRDDGNEVTYNNITQDPYNFEVSKEGLYRIKSISDANCSGDTTGSGYARITYLASPTATISGTDTICPGDTAEIQVFLTGTAPWNFTFLRNGSNQTTVKNILTMHYTLKVTETGTYTLSGVEDALCRGKVEGTGKVSRYITPTAVISGTANICEHTAANLSVALTGAAPWNFSYRLNATTPVEVDQVMSGPKVFPVYNAGTYSLIEVNDKHCRGSVSGSAVITVTPAPQVTLSGLAPAYAKTDEQLVQITGTPAGGTFSGPGLFFSDPNWYFLPGYAPVGTLDIVYAYQESPGSCFGYDTVAVRVLQADAVIDFPDNRSNFCQNESPFTITAVNLSDKIGSFSISGDAGLVDNHDNTATIDPSLLAVQEYTLTYSYFDEMTLSVTINFNIRNSPVADFQWESECYEPGQSIKFSNTSTSTFGTITGSNWKIQTSAGYDTTSTHDVTYSFPQPGNHAIELQIQTSFGCTGKIKKIFGLKPILPLADTNYYEDFETDPPGWLSDSSSSSVVNSWTLGNPSNGFSGAFSGKYCWFTNIPESSSPREQSWVTSPCFDFTGTKRPMLKLNIWRLFNSSRDGANIEVTSDSGKTWLLLGEIGDGLNWFNHYDISGNPGGFPTGWSSNPAGVGNDASWVEARHSLAMLLGKTRVQFRIFYGSDGTAHNNHGIAFDNFWIGEQNRTTLIEHFTNASDNKSKDADLVLNSLVSADSLNIIDLQYHTSFPGTDPFNDQEPYVPGARVLYYGLANVPYSILDGGSVNSHIFDYSKPLDQNIINTESLNESKFDINVQSYLSGNNLNIETDISAREDIPAGEFTVQVAIVEREISGVTTPNGETTFRNVVKALLPDAAGISLYRGWKTKETAQVFSSWNMKNVYNLKELRAISFIQDESTREVYQVAMDNIGILNGINNPIPGSGTENDFNVFPNPASDQIFIRFDNPLTADAKIELYNNLGGRVYSGRIKRGEVEVEIPVADCADGLYILRIINRNQVMGIRKLNIAR